MSVLKEDTPWVDAMKGRKSTGLGYEGSLGPCSREVENGGPIGIEREIVMSVYVLLFSTTFIRVILNVCFT